MSHRAQNRAIYSYNGPSYWVIDSGVNEFFASSIFLYYLEHYDDQWELFTNNEFIEIKEFFTNNGKNDEL